MPAALLANHVCVVTGAASPRGIGLATARLFAEHGARVAILDLDGEQARAAAADIGPGHRGYACDVTDPDQCGATVGTIIAKFGKVDVLVNNAGITQPLKLMDIAPENYQAVLDVNLRVAPCICPRRWCRISASATRVASCVFPRSPPSVAGGFSAVPTTAPPRPGSWGLPRPWPGNWGRTGCG